MNESLHIVAIAGGSGSRFWPLSRRSRPKQLLPLGSDVPLLKATFERVRSITDPSRWWMVVGELHAQACRDCVEDVDAERVLVEPRARNTAPAVALAAIHLLKRDPNAIMAVLPADHHVADGAALAKALDQAASLAEQGYIVTLGVDPTYPETGYGYIQGGELLDATVGGQSGAQIALRFCEKPDLERAEAFLATGGYYWNGGMFVMQAKTYMSELRDQLPAHFDAFSKLAEHIHDSQDSQSAVYERNLAETYDDMNAISIDFGIMEGAKNVVVVPVSCGWSDVGSFRALAAITEKDEHGNASSGRTICIDSKNCFVRAEPGKTVTILGVDNLVVIQTADATLVIPAQRDQDVRRVVAELEHRNWNVFL